MTLTLQAQGYLIYMLVSLNSNFHAIQFYGQPFSGYIMTSEAHQSL